jgi:DNA replication and repair protein RecF
MAAGSVLSGPHKDDLEIYIDGKPAKSYASQGQTRTAALSLKLAERELFYSDSGEYPVLLLDDVLSELDQKRRDFVLNKISSGQVFITLCDSSDMSAYEGRKFEISSGTSIR